MRIFKSASGFGGESFAAEGIFTRHAIHMCAREGAHDAMWGASTDSLNSNEAQLANLAKSLMALIRTPFNKQQIQNWATSTLGNYKFPN